MTANGRSICFVAPFAYPVLARDRSTPFVGGAEVQQCHLARGFARRGYLVSMVCINFGQPDGIVIDGIKVHRMHSLSEGVPVLRFLHPRLTSLWRAMRRADADVYYQQCAGALTGFVAAFARWRGRISLYAGASDLDFDPRLPLIQYARDRAIYRWGLRHATAVVVQSTVQQQACASHFDRSAPVVGSCYPHEGQAASREGVVLWVANMKELKRPELFVELARRCPQYRFRLVGGGDAAYVASVRALAQGLANIEFTGFVPFADVEQHFDGAALFINTSTAEGFPNTFMQSWARGIPTVSFFDPHTSLEGRPVGVVAADFEDMVGKMQSMLGDDGLWRQASEDCRRFASASFSVDATIDAYEGVLAQASRPQ